MHDMLYAPCSQEMFELQHGVTGPHPNCFDNLAGPLAEFGVPSATVTIAFNFFMNVVIGPGGRLEIRPPVSTAGQSITFAAERDVLVAVTSCAAPGANAGGARPIRVGRRRLARPNAQPRHAGGLKPKTGEPLRANVTHVTRDHQGHHPGDPGCPVRKQTAWTHARIGPRGRCNAPKATLARNVTAEDPLPDTRVQTDRRLSAHASSDPAHPAWLSTSAVMVVPGERSRVLLKCRRPIRCRDAGHGCAHPGGNCRYR